MSDRGAAALSTYTAADRGLANTRCYEWNHSLGEIVTALLGQGLTLLSLVEHDWTTSPHPKWLVDLGDRRRAGPAGRP